MQGQWGLKLPLHYNSASTFFRSGLLDSCSTMHTAYYLHTVIQYFAEVPLPATPGQYVGALQLLHCTPPLGSAAVFCGSSITQRFEVVWRRAARVSVPTAP